MRVPVALAVLMLTTTWASSAFAQDPGGPTTKLLETALGQSMASGRLELGPTTAVGGVRFSALSLTVARVQPPPRLILSSSFTSPAYLSQTSPPLRPAVGRVSRKAAVIGVAVLATVAAFYALMGAAYSP